MATTPDHAMTGVIQEQLAARDLRPGEHLVDAGYVTAERLVDSQHEQTDLIGPVPPEPGWQAKAVVCSISMTTTAKSLRVPEKVAFIILPARSPELNAIERVWEDVGGEMAWKHFAHLDCLQDELEAVLATYTAERLQSLSGYPSLVQAELAMVS